MIHTEPIEEKLFGPESLLRRVWRILIGLAAIALVGFVLTKEGQFTRRKPLFTSDKVPSLASSPMVVLIWADRLLVVDTILSHRPENSGEWAEAMCAGIPKKVRFL